MIRCSLPQHVKGALNPLGSYGTKSCLNSTVSRISKFLVISATCKPTHFTKQFSTSFTDIKKKKSEQLQNQCEQVQKIILRDQVTTPENIKKIVFDYYNNLGMNMHYFETYTPDSIASHINCMIAANMLHKYSKDDYFPVIHQRGQNEVIVISRASLAMRQVSENYAAEQMIESQYLHLEGISPSWRLQSYRSEGSISDSHINADQRLRTCFLQLPKYTLLKNKQPQDYEKELKETEARLSKEKVTDLSVLIDEDLHKAIKNTKTERILYELNKELLEDHTQIGLKCRREYEHDKKMYRIDLAFRRNIGLERFYSSIGDIITTYGAYSQRKYVEPLLNGNSTITLFLKKQQINEKDSLNNDIWFNNVRLKDLSLHTRVDEIIKAIHMRHILPESAYNQLCYERKLTPFEAAYCHAVGSFTYQFSQSVGYAFSRISKVLDQFRHQIAQQDLYDVRSKLKQTPLTENVVRRIVSTHSDIVKRIFQEFRQCHDPLFLQKEKLQGKKKGDNTKILRQMITNNRDLTLQKDIQKLDDVEAQMVFEWFLKFNESILKTNFFKTDHKALAFRCNPASFLQASDFDEIPHAVMFLIGNKFQGFHSRFAEIARGGIRIVQSMSKPAYQTNSKKVFDEVYKLSATQHNKNKDIPEGGSKGIILLEPTYTAEATAQLTRTAFIRYIDAFLDLLLPNPMIVDWLDKPEICFLGPDEHTGVGGLMDWASMHAKIRGAPFWKAFTTGKDPSLGGIPHDVYAMTTTSVETFVRGVLQKLNKSEEETTKCQTGGPDGDLGSNSILMSKTKLTTLIDGEGVLHDPNGLDHQELVRLAQRRFNNLPTSSMHFDDKKLSKNGFKIPKNAKDVYLPNGTLVENGLTFRNTFHLNSLAKAFLFNPNGGRPESITPYNVNQLFDDKNVPLYKVIVEGANVFITDDARMALEKKGVILFKDASTNKGGVTSSSLEVLAALVLDDNSFESMMCVKNTIQPPKFYQNYVFAVQQKIKDNASKEFELLWTEGEKTGIPRSILTDTISKKIISLKTDILNSCTLWEDTKLRSVVLHKSIPSVLMPGHVSLATLLSRTPEAYLQALFASFLASQFVYKYGLNSSSVAFMNFVQELKKQ